MKLGLWLQDYSASTPKRFWDVMKKVKESDIDIFVFPECSYTPFSQYINEADLLAEESERYFAEAIKLTEEIGKPVVFSEQDKYGTIFSWYYNPKPKEGETQQKIYIKHTATEFSAFDFEDYRGQIYEEAFAPIVFQNQRIGLIICYDCNHALFSRTYGVDGVDILINSTGGNVVYDKWYRYNQTRAIENACFCFVTMGYAGDKKKIDSYVYGFDKNGQQMTYANLMEKNISKTNLLDSVYLYDTESYGVIAKSEETNCTYNKNEDLWIEGGNVAEYLNKSIELKAGLYVYDNKGTAVVFCVLKNEAIMYPEKVLALMYSSELEKYSKKKYIIVNQWNDLQWKYYKETLEVVLRVRSMENFCAVILESALMNLCFQCGKNRTSQEVCPKAGRFGIDTSRMGGPEAIWKNKPGMMKARWRSHYEWMLERLQVKK